LNLGFLTESKINRRKLASVMLLNLGTLSWFFVFNNYVIEIFQTLTPNTPDWGAIVGNSLFYGSAIFWSIAISFISRRIHRRKLLLTSIILGIFSTVLLGLLEGTFFASILSSLLGMSFGLGLPSSLALVADYTVVENRGRLSGIIVLGTFVIAFVSMAIYRILNPDPDMFNMLDIILLLVVVRSISIFGMVIEKLDRLLIIEKKKTRLNFSEYKEFIFYLCPWVMFTIASTFGHNIIDATTIEPEEVYFARDILRFVFIAIFGLAAGIIADRFGRKLPIIFGLATFGIGFLLLGFNMNDVMSVNIYYSLSGITWGIFFVIFLAVSGDLSTSTLREKFYALGYILPVTVLFALSAIPVHNITEFLPAEIIARILAIFLFLAIVPVFLANETLTESKMQERKMKEYVKNVGKIIQETEEGK
jgi:MFS family permease